MYLLFQWNSKKLINSKYSSHLTSENYIRNRTNCGTKDKTNDSNLIEYIETHLNKTWSTE